MQRPQPGTTLHKLCTDVYLCLAALTCQGGLNAWQTQQVGISTATAKNTNDTDQVSRLLAENQALRLALSKQQGVLPEAVRPFRCQQHV